MKNVLPYELFERNVNAAPSDRGGTRADTSVKEASVVAFYNMLASGVALSPETGVEGVCGALLTYLRSGSPEISLALPEKEVKALKTAFTGTGPDPKYLSYWLSQALALHEKFPGRVMVKNDEFYRLKLLGGRLAGTTPEGWSRMDAVLMLRSSEALSTITDVLTKIIPDLPFGELDQKALKEVAEDQKKLNALNDLFVSEKNPDRDLVAVSLKERRSQGGRANEFMRLLHAAEQKEDETIPAFSNSIATAPKNKYDLIRAIGNVRRDIEKVSNNRVSLGPANYAGAPVQKLKVTYVAYHILHRLCKANAFATMVAWVMNLLFSPPYYTIIGTGLLFTNRGDGETARVQPFWSGMKLALRRAPSAISVTDSENAAGLVVKYEFDLDSGSDTLTGDVEIAIRTSGYENVDVVFRRLSLNETS